MKKNRKKEIIYLVLALLASFSVFAGLIYFVTKDLNITVNPGSGERPPEESRTADHPVQSSVPFVEAFDDNNLSETYLIGFDYFTGDFLEYAPSVLCKVRLDGRLEVEYWYMLSNGSTTADIVLYDLTDEQFSEISDTIRLRSLFNLDPECPNPEDVCDGGFSYLYIYTKDEEVLKACGGFCPSNKEFLGMERAIYDNLPEDFLESIDTYKRKWNFATLRDHVDYGVYIGYNGPLNYDLAGLSVIDAQGYNKAEIENFKDSCHYILSYINVGSLENYRDYYDEYKDLALGVYENWEDEVWIDVSDERWQSFILNELAPALIEKGVDGFFVDNCDVYYVYPTQEILDGLSTIMEGLKSMGLPVIINGGDVFLDAYTDAGGNMTDVITGINQESVISRIDWETGKFLRNTQEDMQYFEDYLAKYAEQGAYIYLLEYTDGSSIDIDISNFCIRNDYMYYISHSLALDGP